MRVGTVSPFTPVFTGHQPKTEKPDVPKESPTRTGSLRNSLMAMAALGMSGLIGCDTTLPAPKTQSVAVAPVAEAPVERTFKQVSFYAHSLSNAAKTLFPEGYTGKVFIIEDDSAPSMPSYIPVGKDKADTARLHGVIENLSKNNNPNIYSATSFKLKGAVLPDKAPFQVSSMPDKWPTYLLRVTEDPTPESKP